mmetsp:Transcript_102512/g.177040  ORF Transcript_102512/g.177040 Transcript_102512/m.177040 type:complete len:123 (-) Transcript_102512:2243-2611(-)
MAWLLVRASGPDVLKVGRGLARVLSPSAVLFAPRQLHASTRTSLSLHMGRIGSAWALRLWVDVYRQSESTKESEQKEKEESEKDTSAVHVRSFTRKRMSAGLQKTSRREFLKCRKELKRHRR